jgi:hypothetical protein
LLLPKIGEKCRIQTIQGFLTRVYANGIIPNV